MDWRTMLAHITGTVDEGLRLRNEYLIAENRILRAHVAGRPKLTDPERETLAVIGKELGRKVLAEVATLVTPDTILGWHRKLVARKFDGSKKRGAIGRPPVSAEIEALVLRLARENRTWGYRRIVGALADLGRAVSHQTVAAILKRHDLAPAPERKRGTTWAEFIRTHQDVLAAADFFTAEVWTLGGLVTYYVLFFVHLATREVHIAGVTPNPTEAWMTQMARNVSMADLGFLKRGHRLLHDRDTKFSAAFRATLGAVGVESVPLPPHSPNLNAVAERWVRSVKDDCLNRVVLFGEGALRRCLREYGAHYHGERNHQGRENRILFPRDADRIGAGTGTVEERERLGGLLRFYRRVAG